MQASLDGRLATWLLRPHLDLGPFFQGPLHVVSVEECWRSVAEGGTPEIVPQRALTSGFRHQLAREADGAHGAHGVDDPRELPAPLRTPRWQTLCDALDTWPSLSETARRRLASLLHAMAFYHPLSTLIPPDDADPRLRYWRASARFMIELSGRPPESYAARILQPFEALAGDDKADPVVRFDSAAFVFVRKAKTRADRTELADWGRRLAAVLEPAQAALDPFRAALIESRCHRALGFLPQANGDTRALAQVMDRAEAAARTLAAETSLQRLLRAENLHAVMESRTKEALWCGDTERALARARAVVGVDPCDSKAWVELGQVHFRREEWRDASEAYAVAAQLGPPGSIIGRHLAAVCLRRQGHDAVAALLFKDTAECDPDGLSPRNEISRLPASMPFAALKAWSGQTWDWPEFPTFVR